MQNSIPIILFFIATPLILSLLIYALFGKTLRRRKRNQIKRLLESDD